MLSLRYCAGRAREVEHVQREPPPVRLSNAQLAHDVSRGRGSAPSISSASSQAAGAAPLPQAMQRGAPSLGPLPAAPPRSAGPGADAGPQPQGPPAGGGLR
ncbi:unnamed protein product [Prorocentrum cordatum]|uniref:Uncharacterized protein n=1 Tax=Prorocentrum cordatum TaxID=2364126 RepID=A0ABN9Q0F0_9DINO|nr:unnamed protein product [Polarella glacialis]